MDGLKELQQELGELTTKLRSNLDRSDAGQAIVKDSVEKISDRMDKVEAGIKTQIDLFETKLNRIGFSDKELERKNKETEEDRNQKKAFDSYIRKGTIDPLLVKALSTDSNVDGGFLMPQNQSARFMEALVEISEMRGLVTVESISQGDSLEIDGDDSTAWGSGWLAERVDPVETGTGQGRLEEIPVHEQYAEPKATRKSLTDPRRDLESWINRKVAQRFAKDEGTAIINGNGNRKIEGFLTPTGITEIVSGNASLLTADGLINLFYGLKTFYSRNGTFILERTSIRDIRKLKDTQNQYLWQPGLSSDRPATILGRPFVEMPDMPIIAANSFPIIFGDLRSAYTLVDREGITILRDPFTSKGFIKFFTTRRVGGQVVLKEAIVKHKVSA